MARSRQLRCAFPASPDFCEHSYSVWGNIFSIPAKEPVFSVCWGYTGFLSGDTECQGSSDLPLKIGVNELVEPPPTTEERTIGEQRVVAPRSLAGQ